jgi:polysaccharide pyruvyl transferase CsaB
MVNILITGYYGLGNIGDEAVLSGMINSLSTYIDDVKFSVITNNPEETRALHNVSPIPQSFKKGMMEFIKCQIRDKEMHRAYNSINDCDVFILGGGSLLHDLTIYNLPILLSLLRLAQKKGKITVVYGIGAGPLETKLGKYLCKKNLNRVDLLTVRDSKSKIALENCGVKNVVQTVDPAFAINIPSKSDIDEMLNKMNIVTRDNIISTTAYTKLHNAELHYKTHTDSTPRRKIMANIYDQIMGDYGNTLLFLPTVKMDIDNYVEIDKFMINSEKTTIINYQSDFRYILSILSISDVLIGMRLHSLILATILGIPFVPITYDEKVCSYLRLINLDHLSVNIADIDKPHFEESVYEKYCEVRNNKSFYSKHLLDKADTLRKNAYHTAKLVSEHIH